MKSVSIPNRSRIVPGFRRGRVVQQTKTQLIQTQTRLLRLRAVATDTVSGQNRSNALLERIRFTPCRYGQQPCSQPERSAENHRGNLRPAVVVVVGGIAVHL